MFKEWMCTSGASLLTTSRLEARPSLSGSWSYKTIRMPRSKPTSKTVSFLPNCRNYSPSRSIFWNKASVIANRMKLMETHWVCQTSLRSCSSLWHIVFSARHSWLKRCLLDDLGTMFGQNVLRVFPCRGHGDDTIFLTHKPVPSILY